MGTVRIFFKLDETTTGMVQFGDDSRIEIKEKGSVCFIVKEGGKRILHNVYFILNLRSNIISLSQATEAGCKVRMKDELLTFYDRNG